MERLQESDLVIDYPMDKSMNIAVVTAGVGVGGMDAPEISFKGADYYLFSDCPSKIKNTDRWVVKSLSSDDNFETYPPRRLSKIPKILTHELLPEYDYFIWHDFNFKLSQDPVKLVQDHLRDNDFAFFKHPVRSCWRAELNEVRRLGLENPEILDKHLDYYKQLNIEEGSGLYAAGAFVRRNNEIANNVCSMWYDHISRLSSRDQISLPAVLQIHDPKVKVLPGGIYSNNLIFKYAKSLRARGIIK